MTEQELLNSPYALEQAEISKKRARETAAELKPWPEVLVVANGLEFLTAETITIITQRGQEFHDENRLGEPMPCRDDGYQFVLWKNQVEMMFGVTEDTAQGMIREIRKALGIKNRKQITVKEFCKITGFDEEDFRKALKHLKPDFSRE
jgi:hypothetical protein